MNEHSKETSGLSIREWLRKVSIRIEAIEMAHSIKTEEPDKTYRKHYSPYKWKKNTVSKLFVYGFRKPRKLRGLREQ